MNILDAFKGKFLTVADLDGKEQSYTIAEVSIEEIGQEKDQKPIVRFKEISQGLVLNRTNAEAISEELGEDTDNWIGKQITLRPDKTTFGGKRVDCIRVAVATASRI